jgi:hypothetical protein
VLELHGTNRAVGCLACGARFEPEPIGQTLSAIDAMLEKTGDVEGG